MTVKNFLWGLVFSVIIGLGGYSIWVIYDVIKNQKVTLTIEENKKFEKAYFEGQRDALDGDIRIKRIDARTYIWLKTPHSDTTKPFKDTLHSFGEY